MTTAYEEGPSLVPYFSKGGSSGNRAPSGAKGPGGALLVCQTTCTPGLMSMPGSPLSP